MPVRSTSYLVTHNIDGSLVDIVTVPEGRTLLVKSLTVRNNSSHAMEAYWLVTDDAAHEVVFARISPLPLDSTDTRVGTWTFPAGWKLTIGCAGTTGDEFSAFVSGSLLAGVAT